jgi:hypothetical protein
MDDNQDPLLATLTDDAEGETPTEVETPEQSDESQESQEESQEEVEETTDDSESEAPAEAEQEEEQEQEELDPKEEARRRYEERQKAIQERNARIAEQNKDYLEKSTDEYDQRLRQMEVQQYSTLIENNENTLIGEFERVKANPDLQIFNPENKEAFNEKAYNKAVRDYNAGYVQYDSYGNMIQIKGSLFEHLKETADLLEGAVKSGAVKQVRATRQMKNAADQKPAATPKQQQKDTVLDILTSD